MTIRSISGLVALLLLSVGGTACSVPATGVRVRALQFGWSEEARALRGYTVLVEEPPYRPLSEDGGGPLPTFLLFGVLHGDEPHGDELLEQLLQKLEERQDLVEGRRLIILPVANPDGLARGTRENANGVDLNRNFPTAGWTRRGERHGSGPCSEAETRSVVDLVERYRPIRILSIHSPLHCVNFDGPAADLAARMASACGYPLRAHIGYETPGSFGSWAGVELGIPVITLELRPRLAADELWAEVGPALLEFLAVGRDE